MQKKVFFFRCDFTICAKTMKYNILMKMPDSLRKTRNAELCLVTLILLHSMGKYVK